MCDGILGRNVMGNRWKRSKDVCMYVCVSWVFDGDVIMGN